MLVHMVTEFRETSGASQAEAVATSGTPLKQKYRALVVDLAVRSRRSAHSLG